MILSGADAPPHQCKCRHRSALATAYMSCARIFILLLAYVVLILNTGFFILTVYEVSNNNCGALRNFANTIVPGFSRVLFEEERPPADTKGCGASDWDYGSLIGCPLASVFLVILLAGMHKNRPPLMLAYMTLGGISITLGALVAIVLMYLLFFDSPRRSQTAVITLLAALLEGLFIYLYFNVLSLYQMVLNDESIIQQSMQRAASASASEPAPPIQAPPPHSHFIRHHYSHKVYATP